MFKIKIIRIVLLLFSIYLNSIDANQTQLWESEVNELRGQLRGQFDQILEQNIKIHCIYDKKNEDLKSLFSGKVFLK
jgi:hypothetical protein